MLILAIESSAKPASAAVCLNEKILGQYYQNNGLTHSRTLLAMVESLLANLDIKISDIELLAVSRGPGSFTGVRIGVSAAKGIAWGSDKPICGVSTLEAMAYQALQPGAILCPVMDARRDQVYNALFECSGGTLVRLCGDRAISLNDLASSLCDFEKPCLLIGDGAQMSHDFLLKAGVDCHLPPPMLRYQTAYGVALAAMHAEPTSAVSLEPSYLRPSQAERMRSGAES